MRKLLLLILLAVSLSLFFLSAEEKVTLTAPIQVDAGIADLRATELRLSWSRQNIQIWLSPIDASGAIIPGRAPLFFEYNGSTASNLLKTLNTANLSIKSLQRRIIEKLQADGLIGPGLITGSPEQ